MVRGQKARQAQSAPDSGTEAKAFIISTQSIPFTADELRAMLAIVEDSQSNQPA
jgi:hypothetical protein